MADYNIREIIIPACATSPEKRPSEKPITRHMHSGMILF